MSYYTMEIDDEIVTQKVRDILNHALNRELDITYSDTQQIISKMVKELIYSRKDEIINMVVERATKEIVKKGIPKLLEKIGD